MMVVMLISHQVSGDVKRQPYLNFDGQELSDQITGHELDGTVHSLKTWQVIFVNSDNNRSFRSALANLHRKNGHKQVAVNAVAREVYEHFVPLHLGPLSDRAQYNILLNIIWRR